MIPKACFFVLVKISMIHKDITQSFYLNPKFFLGYANHESIKRNVMVEFRLN